MQLESEFPKADRRREGWQRTSKRLRIAREYTIEARRIVDRAMGRKREEERRG